MANSSDSPTRTAPVGVAAALVAMANAIVNAIVAFGVNLNPGEQASIMAVLNSVIIFLVAVLNVWQIHKSYSERWSHLN